MRDLLRSDPIARVDPTETFVVAALLGALVTVGADAEVTALLARDPAAHVDLTDPGPVEYLLEQFHEMGAHAQAATLLARDPSRTPTKATQSASGLLLAAREPPLRWP